MSVLTFVINLIEVANNMIGISEYISKMKPREKAYIQKLLANISQCLESMSESISDDKLPHSQCAELDVYISELDATLKDKLDREKYNQVLIHLVYAKRSRQQWYGIKIGEGFRAIDGFSGESIDKSKITEAIDKASGTLRALSNVIIS